MTYRLIKRPGYFGRKRDAIIAKWNEEYGKDNWQIVWVAGDKICEFKEACYYFYESSYFRFLTDRPELVNEICSYGECIDNNITNIQSGCDYSKQETFSTHIQDIAVRNVLISYNRKFEGPKDKILTIRSSDSNGFKFGPGNIPFYNPSLITQPSKVPSWANKGSVEDFWQSNKWLRFKENAVD